MKCRLLIFSFLVVLSSVARAGSDVRTGPIRFPLPVSDTVTMVIIGDVMMHARQLEYPHDKFLSGISPFLKEADCAVANMEFTLGGEPYTGYPAFSSPDSYAGYVSDCGVDVFLMANNHILDRGANGLDRTLGVYRNMDGVRFTGAAADAREKESVYPLIIRERGVSIALINFTYGTNTPSDRDWPAVNRTDTTDIANAIRRARQRKADYVIALPHWGEEYRLLHSSAQERLARWLADKGVDAIIGSHPHVVQDSTHIAGIPVVYSTGNAVSNMSATDTRLELAVSISFVRDSIFGRSRMLEPELRFMWCTLPGQLTDSYCTIFVDEWEGRRDEWITPSDYDNMMSTLERVKKATGIRQ